MKDRIKAILKEWLQVKDAVIFTDDIAIEAVTEEIDDAILEMYGTLPSELLKQNEELREALKIIRDAYYSDGEFHEDIIADLKSIARAAITKAEER